jgi:hypothetical protein
MFRVGFETRTSVLERAKTVHALDRAATVIGKYLFIPHRKYMSFKHHSVNSVTGKKSVVYFENHTL